MLTFFLVQEDHEMDGSMLQMMLADGDEGDEILMRSLKVEKYVIKKIRKYINDMTFDHEKKEHEEEIEDLLKKIIVDNKGNTLYQHRDTLLDDKNGKIGLSRVTELPGLIEDEKFFELLDFNFTEEVFVD
mmetsp:Transcript_62750/g.168149  ORF Transcript_62750/g.168149 Transcript_62750/m.168149 type:complete len:130 (-) Transcript_62750:690-1079(-)